MNNQIFLTILSLYNTLSATADIYVLQGEVEIVQGRFAGSHARDQLRRHLGRMQVEKPNPLHSVQLPEFIEQTGKVDAVS